MERKRQIENETHQKRIQEANAIKQKIMENERKMEAKRRREADEAASLLLKREQEIKAMAERNKASQQYSAPIISQN